MHELIDLQAQLDRENQRCWEDMTRARREKDHNAYFAAKYRKEGIAIALALIDRAIHHSLVAA